MELRARDAKGIGKVLGQKWCDFVHSWVFFSTNFVSLVFYPLISLVRHAAPTESIGAENAERAAPVSTPMPTWPGYLMDD